MALNAAIQGKVYRTRFFEVTAPRIHAYAAATNDHNPAFGSGTPLAPPAFPFVAAMEPLTEVMLDPELGVDLSMLVHGEQDHRFFAPIRAGDVLAIGTVLESVDVRPTGHTFTVAVELTRSNGELAAEARSTMFIRRTATAKASEPAPDRGEVVFEIEQTVDDDQAERYAAASGDGNPIHLDPDHARSAGFPGVVVHGMCTFAFASRAVVEGVAGADPRRLRALRAQFSRPVFPGQKLITRGWRTASEPASSFETYGFETVNPRGAAVIRNGRAEVESSGR